MVSVVLPFAIPAAILILILAGYIYYAIPISDIQPLWANDRHADQYSPHCDVLAAVNDNDNDAGLSEPKSPFNAARLTQALTFIPRQVFNENIPSEAVSRCDISNWSIHSDSPMFLEAAEMV